MSDFDKAVGFVIDILEGGDRIIIDAGGVTKYGISKRWHPDVDVENLTRDQAIAIYQREYWPPSGAETQSWPSSLVVFDAAIDQGLSVARRLAYKTDWRDQLLLRLEAYAQIHGPTLGWLNRILKIWNYVEAMS